MRLCSVPGCGKKHNAHGYCSEHYARWRQHGDPLRRVRRKKGEGHQHEASGYVQVGREGRRTYLHRAIWEEANGPLPEGWDVHHGNEDKDDNRLENLIALPHDGHNLLHRRPEGWSWEHASCVECGRTDRPHFAHGLCTPCYKREWRRKRKGAQV